MNLQLAEENKSALDRYPICDLPFVCSLKASGQDLRDVMNSERNRMWMDNNQFIETQKEYNGY